VKKRIAVGVVGTISVLALAYIPGSPPEPGFSAHMKHPKTLQQTFRRGDVTALQDAANYAAWCGGAVEIWSDGDIIVSSCDK
jgi:hypothetical protein